MPIIETEHKQPPARTLIIAGSDSGGGAGIQADIKTVTMLGGYAMTAITAITAQDTTGVHGIWPTPPDAVNAQIKACLTDIGADTVKTGMLHSTALIEQVAENLDTYAQEAACIIDPVMFATSRTPLIDEAAIDALTALMLPGAALITPNAPEAEALTGKSVDGINGQKRAAEALLERGARAALVKGGHLPGKQLTDVLHTQHGEWAFTNERIETQSTHGTGCTLASAIATLLAQMHLSDINARSKESGHPSRHESQNPDTILVNAVTRALAYVHTAIKQAPKLGCGHGPINHGWPVNSNGLAEYNQGNAPTQRD